jgi:ribonuclease J
MVTAPVVTSHGLVANREDRQFERDIKFIIENYLTNSKTAPNISQKVIEDDLRGAIRRYIVKKFKKYPIIVPIVFLS